MAIGGDGSGQVATGDHAVLIQQRSERVTNLPAEAIRPAAEVNAPDGLNNLPRRTEEFVGRSRELDRLDAALADSGTVVIQTVYGLGGIGKSTLAAHWAATRPHGCSPVRWINAASPTSIQEGLAALATALQPALAEALPLEALAEYALQWLATHPGWLLILDNVNDPADIAALLARPTGGRFLITSRLATPWHHLTTVVRLDVLDEAESLDLLTRISSAAGDRDLDGAADLCAELGHLPLAVEQVAAYLAQNTLITPQSYLDLLTEYPAAMYRAGAVAVTPAERTIARIWRVTLDKITAEQPPAADLLRTLAWYAPENIPAGILGGLADPPTLNAALGLLSAYSMITLDAANGTLAVHRLVQALTRTPDPDDGHRTSQHIDLARSRATIQLRAAQCRVVLPNVVDAPANWPLWRAVLPHIDALFEHAPKHTDTETTAAMLDFAGVFLLKEGQIVRAIEYLRRALDGCERLWGCNHSETLICRNNLAYAYGAAGSLDEAIPLFEQTLVEMERVLEADHPATLGCRGNLARVYELAEDLDRAIPLFEQTLDDLARVRGADHEETLASRNNLAHAYESAGDLDRAVSLYEETVSDTQRVLGSDHPQTLKVRDGLAGAYETAEELDKALPLYKRNLADRARILGPDHPDTLVSWSNLAYAYGSAGDMDKAIALSEQNLDDRLRVLGPDHPDTLLARQNLARAYRLGGSLGRAVQLLEENLDDRLRLLGPDHPDTLLARTVLASACQEAGDLDRAILLFAGILADRVRILGSDHRVTLATSDCLASAYSVAGYLDRAVPLFERNLAERVRTLRPFHPDIQLSRYVLAKAYSAAEDWAQAIPLFEQDLADRLRVLGHDDPGTLVFCNNLACAYRASGDLGRAMPLYEQALADAERVLGTNHPTTALIRANLETAIAERNALWIRATLSPDPPA